MNYPQLIRAAEEVDTALAASIVESLTKLAWLMVSSRVSDGRKRTILRQIDSYLQKKAIELDPVLVEAREASLRKIRNELAHGKVRRDIDLAPLYPELWKAIARLGTHLGPMQIENLLAYTLDVPNMNASSRGASPSKVVQIYRPIFNALPAEHQRVLFAELLLRLFTDSDSLSLLEAKSKK